MRQNIKVTPKGIDDIVIDTKKNVDFHIVQTIAENYPRDGILSEESEDSAVRLQKQRVWVINPLDGRGNFKSYYKSLGFDGRYEIFGVHIGLAINREAALGVVYIPTKNKLFFAVRERGAYEVSQASIPTHLFVSEIKLNCPRIELARSIFQNPQTQHLTRLSGARKEGFGNVFGYCITAIADGQIDAYASYPESATRIGEWDVCAPSVILEEAGGIITDFDEQRFTFNNPNPYFSKGVVAQAKTGIINTAEQN